MTTLDERSIRLGAQASDKADAIRQAGALLVESGCIQPGYIDSMMEREKVANTYLGKGITIPHGLPKDRDLILNTGISVTQIPQGVTWNTGEKVYLVVGIAARSDEHIGILANLTHVLDDDETVRRLATTDDPGDIVSALTRPREDGARPQAEPPADFPTFVDLVVPNPTGLHARPATTFVGVAKEFKSEVQVRAGGRVANGKSLASLLKLGVEGGTAIRVSARGEDEAAAVEALRTAVERGLGEGEEVEEDIPKSAVGTATDWEPEPGGQVVQGVPASPGVAIGPIRFVKRTKMVVEVTARDPDVEKDRLTRAIEAARSQLADLHRNVKARSGESEASIFLAHAEFLDDPELRRDVDQRIEGGSSAGWAWQQAIEERVAELKKLKDPLLAGRAVDLSDVGSRVLGFLARRIEESPAAPQTPAILVAEDLTPSDTAGLDPAFALGFCTVGGGPTSHSAIIARALGIPAIVGVGPALLHQPEGAEAVLDGNRGALYVNPSSTSMEAARRAQQAHAAIRMSEETRRYEPAITTDGHRVEVVANIGRVSEAEQAVNAGGEGVGLLRTEFLFLERESPPDEAEQFNAYVTMTRALNGLPLIIRTLDIGGDKEVPYLQLPREDNPFLGIRGIRLCLVRPDLFRPQLRAIYRAAETGPVKIMFPMVSTLEDLRAAKTAAEEVRQELGAGPVEIGIMVEVPSTVLMAEEFAREVDFFSIGTNDLTQYTLAMDRSHPMLARQADGLHPAVLRMVDQTVRAASTQDKWVGVCGGIAGDPLGAAILAGLGVTELSVAIPSIAAVKSQIRGLSMERAQQLAREALACRSAGEVRGLKAA